MNKEESRLIRYFFLDWILTVGEYDVHSKDVTLKVENIVDFLNNIEEVLFE